MRLGLGFSDWELAKEVLSKAGVAENFSSAAGGGASRAVEVSFTRSSAEANQRFLRRNHFQSERLLKANRRSKSAVLMMAMPSSTCYSGGVAGAAHIAHYREEGFCPMVLPRAGFRPSPASRGWRFRSVRRGQVISAAVSEEGLVGSKSAQTLQNGSAATPFTTEGVLPRIGKVSRVTKETSVDVKLNLDGTGICNCNTGIPFLDHMLDQLASHGLLDVEVTAKGDIHIDDHHTNEDIGLAVGTALLQALGDRKGIYRFGDFNAPLDEALVHVVLDLSGRPYLGYVVNIPTQRVGTYDTQLVEHFFQSVVNTSGMTLHIRQLAGKNSHHIIEATFKAFARALRQAIEYDLRRKGTIPSSKGVLSRA